MALLAFARMLGQVHMSPTLARYRHHPGLRQRLNFYECVDLSFGMHLGWAIEGAVGSEFKIDASYLSPNATIAEALEQATSIYGVHILASHTVVEACSKTFSKLCRLIDRVLIHGSKDPLELYCFDVQPLHLEVAPKPSVKWNVRQRFRARQLMEIDKSSNLQKDERDLIV